MTKKSLKVNQIRSLDDGQNGEKRYTLWENKEHFCVAVVGKNSDGTPGTLSVKEGQTVVAIQRTLKNAEGQDITQWYFLDDNAADYVRREADRDIESEIGVAVQMKKQIAAAKVIKEYDLKGVSLKDLSF